MLISPSECFDDSSWLWVCSPNSSPHTNQIAIYAETHWDLCSPFIPIGSLSSCGLEEALNSPRNPIYFKKRQLSCGLVLLRCPTSWATRLPNYLEKCFLCVAHTCRRPQGSRAMSHTDAFKSSNDSPQCTEEDLLSFVDEALSRNRSRCERCMKLLLCSNCDTEHVRARKKPNTQGFETDVCGVIKGPWSRCTGFDDGNPQHVRKQYGLEMIRSLLSTAVLHKTCSNWWNVHVSEIKSYNEFLWRIERLSGSSWFLVRMCKCGLSRIPSP